MAVCQNSLFQSRAVEGWQVVTPLSVGWICFKILCHTLCGGVLTGHKRSKSPPWSGIPVPRTHLHWHSKANARHSGKDGGCYDASRFPAFIHACGWESNISPNLHPILPQSRPMCPDGLSYSFKFTHGIGAVLGLLLSFSADLSVFEETPFWYGAF